MRAIIIGAGYVGLTLGVVASTAGHNVSFVEIDEQKLKQLQSGRAHFYEPQIDDLIKEGMNKGTLCFHGEIAEIKDLGWSDPTIWIITMGTPISSQSSSGAVSSSIERVIANEILPKIRQGDVICLRSTVEVGFCERILRKYGRHVSLAFCPERTVEGRALLELHELPQIIATNTLAAFEVASQFFSFAPKMIRLTGFGEAEMVKLINNSYRDWSFAFANMSAIIMQEHGLNCKEVFEAANESYSRAKIPIPGLVGGPCLEKDPIILSLGLNSQLAQYCLTSREVNRYYFAYHFDKFFSPNDRFYSDKSVALLGAAFKGQPITDDTRGSFVYEAIRNLTERGFLPSGILLFDPLVKCLPTYTGVRITSDLEDIYKNNFDYYILLTNHKEFYSQRFQRYIEGRSEKVLSFWPTIC